MKNLLQTQKTAIGKTNIRSPQLAKYLVRRGFEILWIGEENSKTIFVFRNDTQIPEAIIDYKNRVSICSCNHKNTKLEFDIVKANMLLQFGFKIVDLKPNRNTGKPIFIFGL